MKQVVLTALALLAFLFVLPMVLFGAEGLPRFAPEGESAPLPAVPSVVTPAPQRDRQTTVTLLRAAAGEIQSLSLSDYLEGVVAAEMPAAFHDEALKAQAVAARTYALRRTLFPSEAHPDALVCDDHTCCQAYADPEQMEETWAGETAFYRDKIAQAVAQTDGLGVTYEGELIDAVFHSSSAGSTADAAEVWGTSVPYLKPVDTPEGEEVPNWRTTVTVPLEDFRAAVEARYPQADFGGDYTAWFGPVTYTAAGAVDTLPAGGAPMTGLDYRALFGLRSARFTLTAGEEGVRFTVTGYGHGVGMSQYGANAMAKAGSGFRDILTHYYTGCAVEEIL